MHYVALLDTFQLPYGLSQSLRSWNALRIIVFSDHGVNEPDGLVCGCVTAADTTIENYIQNSTTDPLHPGALGLGQSTASILVNVFLLLSFLTPIAAGIISDNYLGRFRTIRVSLW
jgi:hypothetical protein